MQRQAVIRAVGADGCPALAAVVLAVNKRELSLADEAVVDERVDPNRPQGSLESLHPLLEDLEGLIVKGSFVVRHVVTLAIEVKLDLEEVSIHLVAVVLELDHDAVVGEVLVDVLRLPALPRNVVNLLWILAREDGLLQLLLIFAHPELSVHQSVSTGPLSALQLGALEQLQLVSIEDREVPRSPELLLEGTRVPQPVPQVVGESRCASFKSIQVQKRISLLALRLAMALLGHKDVL
uniref:Uncharacterized protein n=1 Tax=Strombidium rassoulzadegani TaxID=1082188 RepID=A0A7S3CTI3_9SPIT|mmetsp:Transcript_8465/g.14214  ORF Transcript_8465/g.14214 Transcript_8465/m.14214 type:complete len:237 (+) Transcript_8465:654-1364(+)